MKTTPLAQSPPASGSEAALSDAVKALNTTLNRHTKDLSKDLETQMLRLQVTDMELQMLVLARKLREAKEKLIQHYGGTAEATNAELEERLDRIQTKTGWGCEQLSDELGVSKSTLFNNKRAEKLGPTFRKKLAALEARLFSPQNTIADPRHD